MQSLHRDKERNGFGTKFPGDLLPQFVDSANLNDLIIEIYSFTFKLLNHIYFDIIPNNFYFLQYFLTNA